MLARDNLELGQRDRLHRGGCSHFDGEGDTVGGHGKGERSNRWGSGGHLGSSVHSGMPLDAGDEGNLASLISATLALNVARDGDGHGGCRCSGGGGSARRRGWVLGCNLGAEGVRFG